MAPARVAGRAPAASSTGRRTVQPSSGSPNQLAQAARSSRTDQANSGTATLSAPCSAASAGSTASLCRPSRTSAAASNAWARTMTEPPAAGPMVSARRAYWTTSSGALNCNRSAHSTSAAHSGRPPLGGSSFQAATTGCLR
jgi:hypothetical protein